MLRLLITLPLLLLLVLFALSNTQVVDLHLWPTDLVWPVPVSIVVLGGMAIAFLIGAIVLWVSLLGARLRARRAEHARRLLEAQVAELQAELGPLRAPAAALPHVEPGRALTVGAWQG